ncbi:hypothetical protein BU24DRAFT_403551 [Aaosphaeria arxii CBS 175.79]|uniref:Uncharacterized protein n=1 Tax=Aaosphaeria arxii CBS 175.79 TaxID=1450172 RepID=A0A6A5Y588_9PLEO|nr:uncharacterized protein BU24DRAFT_403551 [Aaosphaeria arxii CBS 175.79]KAF2020439.1 hypothetical protein BU24DRAFT_403551 [Aaosphaeria arxii CBS 175.79]
MPKSLSKSSSKPSQKAPARRRRLRERFSTPPSTAVPKDHYGQLATPQRAAIYAILHHFEYHGIPCSLEDIKASHNIPTSTAADVLKSGHVRRLQHTDLPDNRGGLRKFTDSDARKVADYIEEASADEKGATWLDIAEKAGVNCIEEKKVHHPRTIQHRVASVTGVRKATVKRDRTDNVRRKERSDS